MAAMILQILHFLAPILIATYFIAAKTASVCLLQKPTKNAASAKRRIVAIGFLALIVVTFIAQATTYLAQALGQHGWWASQDCVIYVLASTLVWGANGLSLLDTSKTVWHPYLGSWSLGLCLEISILALSALKSDRTSSFVNGRLALEAVRVAAILVLCITGSWYALHDRFVKDKTDEEQEPLLANGSNGHPKQPAYGSAIESDSEAADVDSDAEEPEHMKELKKQQKKRLEESGSWLSYLSEFKTLIPLVWPAKNRFVQSCIAAIGVILLVERTLLVLVPRQLGIVTDRLTEVYGTGEVPYGAIGLWMLLYWLKSSAGISILKKFVELPVEQWSYKKIRSTAFQHIMNLSMEFHNNKNSGELIRAIDQGQSLHSLLDLVFFQVGPMCIDLIVAFVYVYFLFDVYMTFILVLVGISYVWVGAETTKWSVKRRRRFNNAWRNESKVQVESISNWQTVSHFNRSEYECDRYGKTLDQFNKAERHFIFSYYLGNGLQSVIMIIGRLAATFLAVYRVSQGTVPVGHFVTLTFYWGSIERPLAQMSWSIRRVTSMVIDSERLLQLLNTKPSVIDKPDAMDLSVKYGRVEFDHVDFAYDIRKPTIKDVSFVAEAGQTVAFVGETGGGKSTLLKLLYRYFDVAKGGIRIDGQDLRDVTVDSLRESFGMVPQDPSLFNITIMDNIRYAKLDATDEEVQDACRAAAIHDKILTFPDGYKSKVGERGVKLSGGELQRVSIARAILRRPKIVLLDEATSMIDAETESLIQEAFKRLTAGRTTFIVAHRLSTIQHADLILVINDGEIVERGTHEELFRQNGKYVGLWSKQLSKEVKGVIT